MVINGLVGLSLATLCTFVILLLLALFHGYYQLEMFFITLTTVLSFVVTLQSSGVQLVAMRGTSIDVPLKQRKLMKWGIFCLMWTNFAFWYLHCALRLYFNTGGLIGAIIIQLILTFLTILSYMWELD